MSTYHHKKFREYTTLRTLAQKVLQGITDRSTVVLTPDELVRLEWWAQDQRLTPEPYNPDFGDDLLCQCGHPYYRHFDTYDDMAIAGCKYCGCYNFKTP